MAFNGVTKPASKATKQDYMNLLYTDSDSDHVPDLKLPPVKGKKQRRKKSPSNLSKEDGSCDVMCVVKTMLILLVCTTLVILAGLSVWTLQRVSDLQEQVRTMQNSDDGKSDLSLLQEQVKNIDTSLKELKKDDGILDSLKSQVADIGARLRKVEATTDKLNQSVAAAQSLLNTPKQLKSLTDFLASLKSDLIEGQQAQKAKTVELEQRLSSLEAQQLENPLQSAEKKNSMDAQFGDMLSQQIAEVNETTESGITSVKEELLLLKGRLSALESYTKESGLGHDEVETLATALIEEKLKNLTLSSGTVPVGQITSGSPGELSQLSEKINHLEQVMDSKTEFAESMDLVSRGDFLFFKGNTLMSFENINKTVSAFSAELDSLMQRLDTLDAAVLNTSALMADGSAGAVQNEETILESPESPSASTTVPSVKETVLGNDTSKDLVNSEEIKEELGQDLQIEGIETAEGLHKAFVDQWIPNNEQLNTEYVLALLKNKNTETERRLQTFDLDGDGLYSEEELQNALGFHVTPPPRR